MAVKVSDYSAMLRIANKVEIECKRDMSSREFADYKADKAIANYFLGNTRATLKEANSCIEIHYAMPTIWSHEVKYFRTCSWNPL